MSNSTSFVLSGDECAELRGLAEERGVTTGEMARRIVTAALGGLSPRA